MLKKCTNCGGKLVKKESSFFCPYCKSEFFKEELIAEIKTNSSKENTNTPNNQPEKINKQPKVKEKAEKVKKQPKDKKKSEKKKGALSSGGKKRAKKHERTKKREKEGQKARRVGKKSGKPIDKDGRDIL